MHLTTILPTIPSSSTRVEQQCHLTNTEKYQREALGKQSVNSVSVVAQRMGALVSGILMLKEELNVYVSILYSSNIRFKGFMTDIDPFISRL